MKMKLLKTLLASILLSSSPAISRSGGRNEFTIVVGIVAFQITIFMMDAVDSRWTEIAFSGLNLILDLVFYYLIDISKDKIKPFFDSLLVNRNIVVYVLMMHEKTNVY